MEGKPWKGGENFLRPAPAPSCRVSAVPALLPLASLSRGVPHFPVAQLLFIHYWQGAPIPQSQSGSPSHTVHCHQAPGWAAGWVGRGLPLKRVRGARHCMRPRWDLAPQTASNRVPMDISKGTTHSNWAHERVSSFLPFNNGTIVPGTQPPNLCPSSPLLPLNPMSSLLLSPISPAPSCLPLSMFSALDRFLNY